MSIRNFLIILFLIISPALSFAQEKISTAGFLSGNIWYSKETLIAEEKVNIYTLIFNSASGELSGTVEFYDGDRFLGKTDILVPGGGGSKVAFVSWTVTEGYHKVYAVLKNAKLSGTSGSAEVTLESAKTAESEKFVSAPVNKESATTTVKRILEEKINLAEDYASKNLPEPVVDGASSAKGALEAVREEALIWTENKKEELNAKIKELDSGTTSESVSGELLGKAEKPLTYAYSFIVKLLGYIFESAFLFYCAIFITLFLIIRFVKRIFFF